MGRHVRRVPADWQHPRDDQGQFVPLFNGEDFERRLRTWEAGAAAWAQGEFPACAHAGHRQEPYEKWAGARPSPQRYMPCWDPAVCTHYVMYETTTEGTPISPVMESEEALARWLADHGASLSERDVADYATWLAIVQDRWTPSLQLPGGLTEVDTSLS
jgi:hypothetical protein